jgi:hypothetical protein
MFRRLRLEGRVVALPIGDNKRLTKFEGRYTLQVSCHSPIYAVRLYTLLCLKLSTELSTEGAVGLCLFQRRRDRAFLLPFFERSSRGLVRC